MRGHRFKTRETMSKKGNEKKHVVNTKLLYASLFLFACTLAASVTATYAWFEVDNAADVTQIVMNPSYDSNLAIGMKDATGSIDYAESINGYFIQEHDSNYTVNKPISPCSGMYASSWLNDSFDPATGFPTLSQGYQSARHAEGPTGLADKEDYIQLEFYFRSTYDSYLYLDRDCYFDPLSDINEERAKELGGANEMHQSVTGEDLDKVVDSLRVSFLSESFGYTILDPHKTKETYFAGPLDLDRKGYYDFNVVSHKELIYGEIKEDSEPLFSDDPYDNPDEDYSFVSCFHASHQQGVTYVSSPREDYAVKEDSFSFEELCVKDYQNFNDPALTKPLAYLPSGEDVRVVMTLYLEGWDEDATDAIQAAAFAVGLAFTVILDNV